jgi:preprotein translocase subunit SecA
VLDTGAAAVSGILHGIGRYVKPRLRNTRFVRLVNEFGSDLGGLGDEGLQNAAAEMRGILRRQRSFDAATSARSFAIVREASERMLGMRPYDVQIMGAHGLLRQQIVEIRAGEGKTLVATMPAATVAMAGYPVHVVTVNDYLAERDATRMSPLYRFLGLSVGVVRQGMAPGDRRRAYDCDITYCTNKELAFDYLRDRIVLGADAGELKLKCRRFLSDARLPRKTVLRGLYYAIVDEADSVLVDEARTPLIISKNLEDRFDGATCELALQVARNLVPGTDFEVYSDERRVALRPEGCRSIDTMTNAGSRAWQTKVIREEAVRQALTALHLFHRDHHYIVNDGAVRIVDEYTGRIMEDRFWSNGLHQLIEMKEGCDPSVPRATVARMTYQRFFRRYCMLAGMSGTIREVAREVWSVYRLRVTPIPMNRRLNVRMVEDTICNSVPEKWRRIAERARAIHETGAPVLIGTRSIEASRQASAALERLGLEHIVLNAEQSRREAEIIAQAGRIGSITVATNMAGRGTDIKLGEGADASGGLHVIMSERHDSRRIDRQLAGRCGRQGEPGSFEAILSLDDALIVNDGNPHIACVARLAAPHLGDWIARATMRLAQRRAERLHLRMRRDLLKSDQISSDNLAFSGRAE